MHLRQIRGNNYLSIYRESHDPVEQKRSYQNKIIANSQTLIIGSPGSGKSILTSTLLNELYNHNYTILVLTDKPRNEFEQAFCCLPIPEIDEWQKSILKNMEVVETILPAKIYHPFTFNIPTHQLPDIKFYTH